MRVDVEEIAQHLVAVARSFWPDAQRALERTDPLSCAATEEFALKVNVVGAKAIGAGHQFGQHAIRRRRIGEFRIADVMDGHRLDRDWSPGVDEPGDGRRYPPARLSLDKIAPADFDKRMRLGFRGNASRLKIYDADEHVRFFQVLRG